MNVKFMFLFGCVCMIVEFEDIWRLVHVKKDITLDAYEENAFPKNHKKEMSHE